MKVVEVLRLKEVLKVSKVKLLLVGSFLHFYQFCRKESLNYSHKVGST